MTGNNNFKGRTTTSREGRSNNNNSPTTTITSNNNQRVDSPSLNRRTTFSSTSKLLVQPSNSSHPHKEPGHNPSSPSGRNLFKNAPNSASTPNVKLGNSMAVVNKNEQQQQLEENDTPIMIAEELNIDHVGDDDEELTIEVYNNDSNALIESDHGDEIFHSSNATNLSNKETTNVYNVHNDEQEEIEMNSFNNNTNNHHNNVHDEQKEIETNSFNNNTNNTNNRHHYQEETFENNENQFSFAEDINCDEIITNINLNTLLVPPPLENTMSTTSPNTPSSLHVIDAQSTGTSFNSVRLSVTESDGMTHHSLPNNNGSPLYFGNENSLSHHRHSKGGTTPRKSSAMMGSTKSIVELFKQGELSDDLQDDGDDRFRANSSRRKQLSGSCQSEEGERIHAPKLVPSLSRNTLVVDPLIIQKQLGKKIKSMEEHDGEEDVNMAFSFPNNTKHDPNRRRSSSQPVQKTADIQNFTINSPIVAISPTTPRGEESGLEPLSAANVQVSFKEENDIVIDDLPSASTMVQQAGLKKKIPTRQINKNRNGNSVNRPQSLQLSFGTVNHMNRNIMHRGSEDQPRSIRTVNTHRSSVVSTNRSVSEPFVSESIDGSEGISTKGKCFDCLCSIKIILFIVFVSVVVVTGISVWVTGYLSTEFQVVNTIAFASNLKIVELMKNNWMSSVVNFAPRVLNLSRGVLNQLEPNQTLTEALTNERYQSMSRRLFTDTVSQSEMFYQMFAVDIYGNYSGVDISYSTSGSMVERYLINNNTHTLYSWRMQNGNIQYYEGSVPLPQSALGIVVSSVNELKAIDEQRMAKGLEPSNMAVWSSVFQITLTGKWAIGCSIPYYVGNKFTGVLTVIFSLSDLSKKLYSDYAKEEHRRVFVMRKDGALLGSSQGIEQKEVYSSKSHSLLIAQNVNDTVISSIATKLFTDYGIGGVLNVSSIPQNHYLTDTLDNTHFVSVETVTENGLDWLLIHSTTRTSYIELFRQTNYTVVIVSFVLVVISVVVSISVSVLITRPLNSLKKRVDRLSQMNIEQSYDEKIPITFSEVRSIISSVNQMSRGLNSFSKYVPYDIVATIVKSKQPAMLGVQWKTVTLYFSDIASFTNMTEKMSPDTLVELMCDFFTQQTDIIMKTNGTVDKFIGDSIMAFWNDPVPIRSHELAAVESAFSCQEGLVPFNNKWREKLRLIFANKNTESSFENFNMKIRIGLHTGECFIGNIGSVDRMNYTCLGDTVNTTSRLESLNSMYGSSIMISENVYAKVHKKFLCKWVDVVCVKGKAIPINIYSVLSRKESANSDLIKMCSGYQALRELFLSLRFEEAIEFIDQHEDVLSYMAESKEKASYQLIRKKCIEKINEDMPVDEESLFWIASKLHEK